MATLEFRVARVVAANGPLSALPGTRRHRLFLGVGTAVAVYALAGCGSGQAHRSPAVLPGPMVASRPVSPSPVIPPGTSLVARARVPRISVFGSPRSARVVRSLLNPTASGSPLVFLVKGPSHAHGRIEVALPTRPNGSTGWVDVGHIALAVDPYSLDVDLTHHRLTLRRQATIVERQPIGVGRSLTPTPSGTYFVTALLRLTDPAGIYGPYAFGISAHSTVLNEFEGGNGRIGIHGTNQPWAIGNNVSHGCIRLTNAAITRLARIVPLGTPVTIHR